MQKRLEGQLSVQQGGREAGTRLRRPPRTTIASQQPPAAASQA